SSEALRYTYWLHYAEGSAMTPVLLKLIFSKVEKAPLLIRPIAKAISGQVHSMLINPQLKVHADYMESELSKNTWFAGSMFTAADIQMSFPVEAFAARGGVIQTHPKLAGFLNAIHSRPAYQRALAKGGPFTLGSF
ncbi:MAG: glutathione S-transferase, partial [Proteobacteria bacterium]